MGGTISAVPVALSSRYRVGRVIGSGGMSTVYAAYDPLLRRDVALKIFKADASARGDLRTQEAEAQLVASLNHYALTTLFDAGVDTSDPQHPQVYLVMEHIPGSDLRERLRSGPLTPAQVCWLGFDLAEALDYVHEAGFIHHDLKPANVLLANRGAETRIRGKLTDFGIASIIGQPDHSEFTTGTAAYLSPEQVDGLDAVPESDIYSLGLVLLEAVTGRTAFPGSITESAFARLDRDPFIPADVPSGLAAVLRAMTARRPEDRLPLKQVAVRMQAVLVDQIVAARGMDPAALATNEAVRTAALRRYDVLGDWSDDAFDTVTKLATRLLRVPMATVSIAEVDRIWFRSRRGFELSGVDRDPGLSGAVTAAGDAWRVPDALADPHMRRHPLVTGAAGARALASAPLITRDGHRLGSLVALDRVPRDFTDEELEDLTDLAGIVMRELELRLATRRAVLERGRS